MLGTGGPVQDVAVEGTAPGSPRGSRWTLEEMVREVKKTGERQVIDWYVQHEVRSPACKGFAEGQLLDRLALDLSILWPVWLAVLLAS